MAPGDYPVLPEDTGIYYYSEGAANIVYRISVPWPTPPPTAVEEYGDGTPPPSEIEEADKNPANHYLQIFDYKLLRVRKNLPTTAPCTVAHDAWQRLIAPMFKPEHIVDQILVDLGPSKIIERLNKELEGWEKYEYPMKESLRSWGLRPTKRQGVYLADDKHGLLITDMTPEGVEDGTRVTLYEFKPKWLVQSPSAPKNSKRCRQCARIARINAEHARKGETSRQPKFCPLDLISKAPRDILRAANELLSPNSSEKTILRLAEWIQSSELLERLRNSQYLLDRKGVLEADPNDENFLACMTLRDCTLYLRMPDDEMKKEFEARIGDLDLKSPDKAEYWKSVERPLIEEGWYLGLEPEEDWQPLTCHLSPERWDPMKGQRRNTD